MQNEGKPNRQRSRARKRAFPEAARSLGRDEPFSAALPAPFTRDQRSPWSCTLSKLRFFALGGAVGTRVAS